MPSPFPGMDPYLEDPRRWRDVHLNLISGIQDVLTKCLRPRYVVRVEDRVYLSNETDPGRRAIGPDIRIGSVPGASSASIPLASGVATKPIAITTLIDEEIRESRLRILEIESRQLVTVIEVISPTNKIGGATGRKSYLVKRNRVMRSDAHFVEIDLLRRGRAFYTDPMLPPHEYSVHVSNAAERPIGSIWSIRLTEPLPTVSIPVLPRDPDVLLDLQAVLNAAYDRAGYDLDIDYTQPPTPPLKADWAGWADRLLREKGLRRQ